MEGRSWQQDDSKYKFTSKERDLESNYDYFGARYYDARIGRWGSVEPLLERYFSWSSYVYANSNSINLLDRDGTSTHTDREGNVYAVQDDDDLNVYKHDVGINDMGPNPITGGKIMGTTEYWDEFINPETEKPSGKIMFGETWDNTVNELHKKAADMDR